jgi:hypothetical protein
MSRVRSDTVGAGLPSPEERYARAAGTRLRELITAAQDTGAGRWPAPEPASPWRLILTRRLPPLRG